MKVGFVGTGVMGSRMVKRFLEEGYPVTVYKHNTGEIDSFVGSGCGKSGQSSGCCRKLGCHLYVFVDAWRHFKCLLGREGILQSAEEGTILIDFTTVDAETSKTVFLAAAQKEESISWMLL